MRRQSKKTSTATTNTSIPFPVDDHFTDTLDVREYSLKDLLEEEEASREPMQPITLRPSEPLPVSTAPQQSPVNPSNPLAQKLESAEEPLNECMTEHTNMMNINYCIDWGVREGDIIPPDWRGPPIRANRVNEIQTPPAGPNVPTEIVILPAPAIAPEVIYPKITRHKGQRVQTVKTIYTQVPIQYRTALDRLKENTDKSIKEVLCEAIADCAVKHGIASSAGAIMSWPDWD